ncbi:MAG: hypothetical protein AVDCRST_MAG68-1187, partial [uncultured Gemmatimonadetes bacterium]
GRCSHLQARDGGGGRAEVLPRGGALQPVAQRQPGGAPHRRLAAGARLHVLRRARHLPPLAGGRHRAVEDGDGDARPAAQGVHHLLRGRRRPRAVERGVHGVDQQFRVLQPGDHGREPRRHHGARRRSAARPLQPQWLQQPPLPGDGGGAGRGQRLEAQVHPL